MAHETSSEFTSNLKHIVSKYNSSQIGIEGASRIFIHTIFSIAVNLELNNEDAEQDLCQIIEAVVLELYNVNNIEQFYEQFDNQIIDILMNDKNVIYENLIENKINPSKILEKFFEIMVLSNAWSIEEVLDILKRFKTKQINDVWDINGVYSYVKYIIQTKDDLFKGLR